MRKSFDDINTYLDFYEDLLTDKQREIMNEYYREDYSLAEIAENRGISRSAVSDNIKRVTKILEDYEKKLHLLKKFQVRQTLYEKLADEHANIKEIQKKLKESEIENYE
ncbi:MULTISPECIES: YlxM family DNA-binding protein [Breznakia]|uniref:UPF0122 protein EDD63_1134 n=1 Tax=Breznakia blatticola TaxID=1754012 RepID=A0A4R7ZQV3_9FIRM|nr:MULTISPECIES: YlxM family DNA-binding protein [Breznakia]MDH6366746.1 putative DNA-binding protein YlxM (UPF0122 family) [Breznakia sp. PH1-1]MDH6403867.1 putative DNA-binding protein YlxM (UPF0122 family) [Breznakia sp. PF1-11]MDH6411576.1 putative DNA-binding protein YlxM (UPF0122 family) [Breznakia sp. PFB1-11]MDH6413940.1 putative DNA-binding protein YlxM (UPF0122 family) [Breznakia sp. PFB1-14]MDH6416369.1 putative DNA-binding protein YlxM (UPF0122 family) [Breznakia sp. PFB1-4]